MRLPGSDICMFTSSMHRYVRLAAKGTSCNEKPFSREPAPGVSASRARVRVAPPSTRVNLHLTIPPSSRSPTTHLSASTSTSNSLRPDSSRSTGPAHAGRHQRPGNEGVSNNASCHKSDGFRRFPSPESDADRVLRQAREARCEELEATRFSSPPLDEEPADVEIADNNGFTPAERRDREREELIQRPLPQQHGVRIEPNPGPQVEQFPPRQG